MNKDKETNYGYLLGQLTALVESVMPNIEGSFVPRSIASNVFTNPSKLLPWLVELEKMEVETSPYILKSDFMDSVAELFRMHSQGHDRMTLQEQGSYWVGYNHQKAQNSIQLTRQKIGKKVKELRESKGFSQRELAALIGLSHNHICRIESGAYNVNIDTLAKLGAALDAELTII